MMPTSHLVVIVSTVLCVDAGHFSIAQQQPVLPPQQPPVQGQQPPEKPTTEQQRRDRIAEVIAKAIDLKHGGAAYRTYPIMQCDIDVDAGAHSFKATLAYQVNGRAVRMDFSDGSSIVYDGNECWITPISSSIPAGHARLRVQTWRNLLAAPFMANDQHAKVSSFRASMVMGADADAFAVSWPLHPELGGGRTPKLIAYAEARTHEMSVIASDDLPVMLGFETEGKSPRCVVYADITNYNNVMIPVTWWLYDWTEAATVRGDRLGKVTITNIRFPRASDVTFEAPNHARLDGTYSDR